MVRHPPGEGRALSGVPLLIVAELPPDVFAWADALRQVHYRPGRNRMGAHVTLFHGLPPSAKESVLALLTDLSREAPAEAAISGIMDLDPGTAFAIDSPALIALHEEMAERLHGLIQQRDARPFRPHVTIQAKVSTAEAKSLQAYLALSLQPRDFRFRGFGLYGWTGEIWRQERLFPFRGRN